MSTNMREARNENRTQSNVLFGRLLFIFAKNGRVKCYSAEEIRPIESDVKREGWHHTAH